MTELGFLASLFGLTALAVVAAVAALVASGRAVPFPTSTAAWWSGRSGGAARREQRPRRSVRRLRPAHAR